MARRRMITNLITNTTDFISLPKAAQALYLHLVANTDDDGVVESAVIMRTTKSKAKSLQELVDNGFVIPIAEDVVWVKDWHTFNSVKNGRGHPSRHREALIAHVPGIENALFKPFVGENVRTSGALDKNRVDKNRVEQDTPTDKAKMEKFLRQLEDMS